MAYLKTNADIIYSNLYQFFLSGFAAGGHIISAGNDLKIQDFVSAGEYLRAAGQSLEDAFDYMWAAAPKELLNWYWVENNWVEEYELTWRAICEAWAENDFEGRGVTIAFIDRMRQLIWNEPFYVAWAARPESEY